MIDRVLEWYRIVNVQPSPETIQRRKAACMALVKSLAESDDWEKLAGTAAGVVAGFKTGHAQSAAHVALILKTLQDEDALVPNDLAENNVELRAAGAVALGELMARNPDKPADKTAVMTAMFIESGTGIRSRPAGRHLAKVLDELGELARQVLNGAQQRRRRRSAITTVTKIPAFGEGQTDALANVKSLAAAVKSALTDLSQQSMIDREELDILWWLYSGSTSTGTAYAELAPGIAAAMAGSEVANLCLLPPLVNAPGFVREAMSKVKKADANRALDKIISETDATVWTLLNAPSGLPERYPALFPVSWLCGRLASSGGTAGWNKEFQEKTGIDPDQAQSTVAFAVQVFRERIAHRQFAPAD